MKKFGLLILTLFEFYTVNAGRTQNIYYVTITPNGFKVLSEPPAECAIGNDIPCVISTDGAYSVGSTIPNSVPHVTLWAKSI